MKNRAVLSLFCLTLLISPFNSLAASGDTDRSYGYNGTAFFPVTDSSTVLAIQADNKVIAAGQCFMPSLGKSHFCLRRFTASGAVDTAFGIQGTVNTPVTGPVGDEISAIQKILVLPDGKILAVGYTFRHRNDIDRDYNQFAIARYNPDGSLDTTLDGDGTFSDRITVSETGARALDAAVQPDGKFIVVGGVYNNSSERFIAARFNYNGSLDTSFRGNGKLLENWGASGWAATVTVQPNGKILIGGMGGFYYSGVVARYNSDGVLDTSFGDYGKVFFSGPGFNAANRVRKLTIFPDGKFLVMSNTFVGAWPSILFAKFNSDGSYDNTFGTGGTVSTNLSPEQYCEAKDFQVTTGGKIVVAANCHISTSTFAGDAAFGAGFLPNGSLDKQFGHQGFFFKLQSQHNDSVVIQSDGRLVFGGNYTVQYPNNNRFFLTRYLNNGTREVDFDNDSKSDLSVFRPATGVWYLNSSAAGVSAQQFGAAGDNITPGDYDGDGKIDIAVFRNGGWYIWRSSDNTVTGINFGSAGDIPVVGDYDGDNRSDVAVFRQGLWYIIHSADGSVRIEQFGAAGDRPVTGNFDGDQRSDIGVYRGGVWYTYNSTAGVLINQFGVASDKPVPADYDGDGKTDIAVYRDGAWYIAGSLAGVFGYNFGNATDRPVPADYDGDGISDAAIYRDGTWYLQRSSAGLEVSVFGAVDDIPVPTAYLH